ncbi:MAG: hypothetical protein NVS2B7_28460 [Herpetosiphon sp.]
MRKTLPSWCTIRKQYSRGFPYISDGKLIDLDAVVASLDLG